MGLKQIKACARSFLNDESGATAVEYALLAAILSIGVLFSLEAIGDDISNDFDLLGNTIDRQDINTGIVD